MNSTDIFYAIVGFGSGTIFLLLLPLFLKIIRELFKNTKYSSLGESSKIRLVRQIDEAVKVLSKMKNGAIITIVNKDSVDNLRTDGVKINASISSDLIVAIFNKLSPLHDGAIVIDSNQITYVATYYKITKKSLRNHYGARHRAAMGISEVSDSLTIVISEETGQITLVKDGVFKTVQPNDFQEKFTEYLK